MMWRRALGLVALSLGLVACGGDENADKELDILLYNPFELDSLLNPAESQVDAIEMVAVPIGAPPSEVRINEFSLERGEGSLPRLQLDFDYQLFFRGFSGDSLVFYGGTRPVKVDEDGALRAAVLVGPTNCIVSNAGAPPPFSSAGGTHDLGRRRVGHTATRLIDGRILIMGGAELQSGLIVSIHDTMEIYDPNEGTFTELGGAFRLQSPRAWHTATLMRDGRVLVVGGLTTVEGIQEPAKTISIVDVANPNNPVQLASGLFPEGEQRYRHKAVLLDDATGSVLIAGGYGADRLPLASTWRYFPNTSGNPADGIFRQQGAMCDARVDHTTTALFFQGGAAQAVSAGGRTANGNGGLAPLDTVELFTSNPNQSNCCDTGGSPSEDNGCWVRPAGPGLEAPRYHHTAVHVDDQRQVVFVGGVTDPEGLTPVTGLEMMDVNLTLWGSGTVGTLGDPADAGGAEMGVAALPDDRIVVVGGRRGETLLNAAFQLQAVRNNPNNPVRPDANGTPQPVVGFGTARLPNECLGEARYDLQAVTGANGTVLLTGGMTRTGEGERTTGRAELYFPVVGDLPSFYPDPSSGL